MRTRTVCVVAAWVCVSVLALTQPVTAELYVYDCNSLSVNYGGVPGDNFLNLQDNWGTWYTGRGHVDGSAFRVFESPYRGAPHPGDGMVIGNHGEVVPQSGTTHNQWATRVNDGNWGYDLTGYGQSPFFLRMSVAVDYVVSGYYGNAKFGIGTPNDKFRFGLNVEEWYYGVCIWNAQGTKILGTQPRPPVAIAGHEVWDYQLLVEPWKHGGEGSASLSTMERGLHIDWQPVGGLQDVNLRLATQGMDVSLTDRLLLEIRTGLVAFDNLVVKTPIPGDANMDDIVDSQDFSTLKGYFGQTPTSWYEANFNRHEDLLVDTQDFSVLKAHFGETQPSGLAAPGVSATPEPATLGLLALGGLALIRRRRS